jgi:hypothetical protein
MNGMIRADGKGVVVLATVLLVGVMIGGIGFVLGRDSAEPAQAQSVARSAQTEAIAKARKAGYESGFADGRKAGARSAGRDEPDASGRDALSADGFDLEPGSYYIVQVDGDSKISDYAPMQAGTSYQLCDAYGVCVSGG